MKPMKAMKAMEAMKATKVTLANRALAKHEAWRKAEEKAGDASCNAAALWSASFKKKFAAEAAVAAYNAAESGSESYRIVEIGPESYLQGAK